MMLFLCTCIYAFEHHVTPEVWKKTLVTHTMSACICPLPPLGLCDVILFMLHFPLLYVSSRKGFINNMYSFWGFSFCAVHVVVSEQVSKIDFKVKNTVSYYTNCPNVQWNFSIFCSTIWIFSAKALLWFY